MTVIYIALGIFLFLAIEVICDLIASNLKKKERIIREMEQNTLLERKQTLLSQLDELDEQLIALQSVDPLYIKKEQLETELADIEEQLESEDEVAERLFTEYLVEQGYVEEPDEWTTIYSQEFEGYYIWVNVDDLEILVYTDTDNDATWSSCYDDFDELKAALSTLQVQKSVVTLTIEQSFVVVNGENSVTSATEALELIEAEGVSYVTDLEDLVTGFSVRSE
jgi:hypothetical protein